MLRQELGIGYSLFSGTMRRRLSITLLVLSTLSAGSALAAQSLTTVTFNWTTNNAAQGWPNCSSTVTTVCVSGYTLTDTTNSASPVVISSTIAATAITYVLTPLPTPGTHTYSLVTNGLGSTGQAVTSTPATASALIPNGNVPPPAGFAITP